MFLCQPNFDLLRTACALTSNHSNGFCAIWACISSSSSFASKVKNANQQLALWQLITRTGSPFVKEREQPFSASATHGSTSELM